MDVLHCRQLSLKVATNSLYGCMGTSMGMLPFMCGARSVTCLGRHLVHKLRDFIVDTYDGREIYGDTDSTMVVLPDGTVSDPLQCLEYGRRIVSTINGVEPGGRAWNGEILPLGKDGVFGGCIRIESEKAMRMVAIAKKKYAALVYNDRGSFDEPDTSPTLYTRGMVVDKRDSCRAMKECYRQILLDALLYRPYSEVLPSIARAYKRIIDSNDPRDFEATVKVAKKYASTHCYMHLFTSNMAKRGTPLQVGSRVSYVIVNRGENASKKLGDNMVLMEDFDRSRDRINSEYYLVHKMTRNIDQLCELLYKKELTSRASGRMSGNTIPLYHPIKVMTMLASRCKGSGECVEAYCKRLSAALDKPRYPSGGQLERQ